MRLAQQQRALGPQVQPYRPPRFAPESAAAADPGPLLSPPFAVPQLEVQLEVERTAAAEGAPPRDPVAIRRRAADPSPASLTAVEPPRPTAATLASPAAPEGQSEISKTSDVSISKQVPIFLDAARPATAIRPDLPSLSPAARDSQPAAATPSLGEDEPPPERQPGPTARPAAAARRAKPAAGPALDLPVRTAVPSPPLASRRREEPPDSHRQPSTELSESAPAAPAAPRPRSPSAPRWVAPERQPSLGGTDQDRQTPPPPTSLPLALATAEPRPPAPIARSPVAAESPAPTALRPASLAPGLAIGRTSPVAAPGAADAPPGSSVLTPALAALGTASGSAAATERVGTAELAGAAPAQVHIRIGRIEIRSAAPAASPTAPTARAPQRPTPALSLNEYLRRPLGGPQRGE